VGPLPTAGWALLLAAAVCAAAGLVAGLAQPQAARLLALLRLAALAASGAAMALLTALVMRAEPGVAYAVQNHAPAGSPLGYRVAAVWAGQAGGLMLWSLEVGLVSLFLRSGRQPRALAILLGIQACLLGLAAADNPFSPAVAGMGGGLNPMLRHALMVIHPPMVFLGYALLAAPFAITLAALLERKPEAWPLQVRPWLLAAWLALTAGNGFGALWAYRTFGWGGFWAWDPVENTSLVPWLLAGVAVHGLWQAGQGRGRLRLAAAAAMGAFLATLYGSFLARSGLLAGASVHAYLEQATLFQWALGSLLGAGTLLAIIALARAWRGWGLEAAGAPRPWSLTVGTVVLLAVAGLVLVGMSLPMFDIVPTLAAYNMAIMPLAILMLGLLAWPRNPAKGSLVVTAIGSLLLGGLFAGAAFLLTPGVEAGIRPWRLAQGAAAGALVTLAAVVALRSLWGLVAGGYRPSGLAHAGVALLIMGAVLSGYGTRTEQIFLPRGEAGMVAGHRLSVVGTGEPQPGVRRVKVIVDGRQAHAEIEQDLHFNVELRRAWIHSGPVADLYLVPSAVIPRDLEWRGRRIPAGAMLQLSVKPGMRLVWLGMILIALGLGWALAIRHRPAQA